MLDLSTDSDPVSPFFTVVQFVNENVDEVSGKTSTKSFLSFRVPVPTGVCPFGYSFIWLGLDTTQ